MALSAVQRKGGRNARKKEAKKKALVTKAREVIDWFVPFFVFYVATTMRGLTAIGAFIYFAHIQKRYLPCISLMVAEVLIFYDTGISEGMPGYALARRITKASGFEVASLSYLLLTFGNSFYEKAMAEWYPKKKEEEDDEDANGEEDGDGGGEDDGGKKKKEKGS